MIDEDTGAFVDSEARADTNITKTHIVWSAEDCAGDENPEGCIVKINLNTTLSCYLDKQFTQLAHKNSSIIVGDTLYCELKFIDPTIKKYLHLTSVRVVEEETKDVLPTGYYGFVEKTIDYVRFSILVYWPRLYSTIIANAKVSNEAECHNNENCLACNPADCLECSGGLFTQGKECVVSCDKGHYKKGSDCDDCEQNC